LSYLPVSRTHGIYKLADFLNLEVFLIKS